MNHGIVHAQARDIVQQILLFFVLTLILTVILAAGQEATGLLASQVILAQLAPGLAGVMLALIFRMNAPGLNFSVEGITLKSVMGAVLLPLGAALIVLLIATLITRVMRFGGVDMSASPVSLIGMIIGAVGEETGWRGFLHRRLNQRLNGLVSSLIVGINDTPFIIGMALVWVVIALGIVTMNRQTFLKAPRSQVA